MIKQGNFTSTGKDEYVAIPIGATWMKVVNLTNSTIPGAGDITDAYWQTSLSNGIGQIWNGAADATGPVAFGANTGFEAFNSGSDNPLGPVNATTTAISAAAIPLVSATSTAGLKDGSIIRMRSAIGATQLNGMDFQINNLVANTQFDLIYMAQIVAGTTATFYPVKFEDIWYPRSRFISKIVVGTTTVVTMTVDHEFEVDDIVRVRVPAEFAMIQIDELKGKVTAKTDSTITLDIDSTTFTAFAFPVTGTTLTSWAQILPMSPSPLNSGRIGIKLTAGAAQPAGETGHFISWIAGNDGVF